MLSNHNRIKLNLYQDNRRSGAMASELEIEPLVVPIWPGLRLLGYRTKSAAYDAVRRGVIPPEALVQIGEMQRVSVTWIRRKAKASGEAA